MVCQFTQKLFKKFHSAFQRNSERLNGVRIFFFFFSWLIFPLRVEGMKHRFRINWHIPKFDLKGTGNHITWDEFDYLGIKPWVKYSFKRSLYVSTLNDLRNPSLFNCLAILCWTFCRFDLLFESLAGVYLSFRFWFASKRRFEIQILWRSVTVSFFFSFSNKCNNSFRGSFQCLKLRPNVRKRSWSACLNLCCYFPLRIMINSLTQFGFRICFGKKRNGIRSF